MKLNKTAVQRIMLVLFMLSFDFGALLCSEVDTNQNLFIAIDIHKDLNINAVSELIKNLREVLKASAIPLSNDEQEPHITLVDNQKMNDARFNKYKTCMQKTINQNYGQIDITEAFQNSHIIYFRDEWIVIAFKDPALNKLRATLQACHIDGYTPTEIDLKYMPHISLAKTKDVDAAMKSNLLKQLNLILEQFNVDNQEKILVQGISLDIKSRRVEHINLTKSPSKRSISEERPPSRLESPVSTGSRSETPEVWAALRSITPSSLPKTVFKPIPALGAPKYVPSEGALLPRPIPAEKMLPSRSKSPVLIKSSSGSSTINSPTKIKIELPKKVTFWAEIGNVPISETNAVLRLVNPLQAKGKKRWVGKQALFIDEPIRKHQQKTKEGKVINWENWETKKDVSKKEQQDVPTFYYVVKDKTDLPKAYVFALQKAEEKNIPSLILQPSPTIPLKEQAVSALNVINNYIAQHQESKITSIHFLVPYRDKENLPPIAQALRNYIPSQINTSAQETEDERKASTKEQQEEPLYQLGF